MKKRILALVLTLAMLLSLLPGQVFATKTETAITEQTQQSVQTQQSTQTQQTPQVEEPYILTLLDDDAYDAAVADLTYLTKTIGIRTIDSEKEALAQDYVAAEFAELGYEVIRQEADSSGILSVSPPIETENVIGVKKAAVETDLTIYVSSHIDTVDPSPGANDNGSGVVGMLAIARAFKDIDTNYNIAFCSFGGEERGRVGSSGFTMSLTDVEKANAICDYNLDMIATGYDGCDYMLMMTADGMDNHATMVTRNAAEFLNYGTEQFKTVGGTPADHKSFHDVGIPAVQFYWSSINTHFDYNKVEPYYHTANDNMEMNFSRDRLEQMVDAVALAVYNDATADYAAVVGEGTDREYYTTMEEAVAAAGGTKTVTDLKAHRNHDGVTFATEINQAFVDGNSQFGFFLLEESGIYYLTENITISPAISVYGDITICLNGYNIYGEPGVEVEGAFTLYDCQEDGCFHAGAVILGETHLKGGTLSISDSDGFGVGYSTLYLEGGNLIASENMIPSEALIHFDEINSALVLNSGTISAPYGGNSLILYGYGSATMSGDVEIIGNPDAADIFLSSYYEASRGWYARITLAEGFDPNGETYTIAYDGTIPAGGYQITSGWSAAKAANGIDYIPFESFDKSYVVFEKGGELYIGNPPHTHEDVEFTVELTQAMVDSYSTGSTVTLPEGSYYLSNNVNLSKEFRINHGGTVYLCLKGKTISGYQRLNVTDGSKVYICDCTGNGVFEAGDVYVETNSNTELHLCGGKVISNYHIGFRADYGKVYINGGTFESVNTDSDEASGYGYGNNGATILTAGKVINHGGCGVIAVLGTGPVVFNGDIELIGDEGCPDVYMYDLKNFAPELITIGEGFNPKGQIYTVKLDGMTIGSGQKHQLTSGWGQYASHLDYIPFNAQYQDYAVVEIGEGTAKELYLVPCKDEHLYQTHSHNGVGFETLLDQDAADSMIYSQGSSYGIALTEGSYILTEDLRIDGIVLSEFAITDPIDINICLHGHDITMEGYASTWGPVNLNIYDCKGTGKIHSNAASETASSAQGAALWIYDANSTVNLYGGNISSNGDFGILAEGGITNIYGGTVTADTAVCVRRQDENWGENRGVGTLNISGDLVLNGTDADIYLDKDLVVNIVGNLTPTEGETYTVKVSDEELADLLANGGMRQITSGWGAMTEQPKDIPFVYHDSNYTIASKTVDGATELYLLPPHSHTVSTDCHVGTTADPNVTFTTKLTQGFFTNTWTDGMNVVLMGDITASGNVTVSGKVNLCLNGYTLDLVDYQIQVSENAELSICDCNDSGSASGGQIIASGETVNGAIRAESGSALRIHGGTISVTGTYGVFFSGSTMEMTGGVIRQLDNQQALRIESGNVTITGGTISYEGTNKYQQAVYIKGAILTLNGASAKIQAPNGGMGLTTDSNGKAILTKGTITTSHIAVNNKATVEINGPVNITSTNDRGIENNGTATISAGTITGTNYGINQNGTLVLFGDPVINGGTMADIHLQDGKKITLTEDNRLEGTDTYSVSVETPLKALEKRTITEDWPFAHADVTQWPFSSFDSTYEIRGGGWDDLYLYYPHNHAMSVDCETSGDKVIEFDKVLTANFSSIPGGNYVLTSNVTVTKSNGNFYTEAGVVNLCLNGFTLDLASSYILLNNNLNICDCSENKSGKIVISENDGDKGMFGKHVKAVANTLTIYGGTFINNEGSIISNGAFGSVKVNLYGGIFESKKTTFGRDCAVTIHSNDVAITSQEGYGIDVSHSQTSLALNASPEINGALGDIRLAANKKISIGGDLKRTDEETYRIVTETLPTAAAPNVRFTTSWGSYNGDPNIFTHDNLTYTIGTVAADPAHGIAASSELHIKGHVHEVTDENGNKTFIVYDTALTSDFLNSCEEGSSQYLIFPAGNYLLIEENLTASRTYHFNAGESHICLCGKNATFPEATDGNPSIRIDNGALLRIDDCQENVGTLTVNWMGPLANVFNNETNGSGTLIIARGKVTSTKTSPGGLNHKITLGGGGSFRLEGGVIDAHDFGYFNFGLNTEATILGGTISANENAIYLQVGKVYLEGNPVLDGGSADIWYEKSGQYIHFRQGHPLEMPDEAYTIGISNKYVGTPSESNAIRLTSGWEYSGLASTNNGGDAKIPFFSTQGYAVREIADANGVKELYLVIPEVTVKYEASKGTASASPDSGVGAEITVTAEPKEGYAISAITWSYWDGTKTVTNSIDVSDAGEGAVTKTFDMPAADVTVTVDFNELHKHDGQTFAAITGNGGTRDIHGILEGGGAFFLEGDGVFKSGEYTDLDNKLYLCLNGKKLYVSQIEPTVDVYICDCTRGGELIFEEGSPYWWNTSGTTTFKGITITSLGDDVRGMFHSNPGKIVFDGCTVTDVNPTRTLNVANYGAWYEVRNTTIINNGDGYAVDVEVPTFVLDGYSKIESANKADIRLSYQHNTDSHVSIIKIGEDFNPAPEGKDKLEYTFDLYKERVLKVGEPLQITDGWSVAKAKNGIDYIPFIFQEDPNDPSDDLYEVFEMFGEIWVGIPHTHIDRDGNLKKYYFHITQDNIEKHDYTWAAGTYFVHDESVTIPEYNTSLRNTGDIDLCLNNHTLKFEGHEMDVEATDSTVTIDDCGTNGTAIFRSYRAKNGTLKLLGGRIVGVAPAGASEAWPNRQIIVDGATLVSTATASDAETQKYGVPYSKMCPAVYGAGGGATITMVSGTIMKEGVDGNAVLIYQGSYEMRGDITLTCSGNYADIYFYNHIPIDITGPITPPEGETYTVEIRPTLQRGETYRITDGWSEKSECDFIPFVSTQGYIVYLEEADGELYLTPPEVTVEVYDPGMGVAVATPDYGPGGYDYYGNVRTPVVITATPEEGYYVKSMSMSYYYVTDRDHEDKIFTRSIPSNAEGVPQELTYTIDENGVATARFDMPVADVLVKVVFESTMLDEPMDIYLWKNHEAVVEEEAFMEELKACDPNKKLFEDENTYSLTDITAPEIYGFTMERKQEDGKNYILFKTTESGLLQGTFKFSYSINGIAAEQSVEVKINVRSFEVKDSVFVLDYDKAVKLGEGLYDRDILPGTGLGLNAGQSVDMGLILEAFSTTEPVYGVDYETLTQSLQVTASDGKGTFGDFTISKELSDAIYTPKAMLNGVDSLYLAFRAHKLAEEASTDGTVDLFKEVAMYKTVTVLPANIVYYEDDNAALKWNPGENTDIKIDIIGSSGGYQDGDNHSEYGNDSDYQYAHDGEYPGSGGVTTKITIGAAGPVLTFSFTGTGFDLIGSTTADSGQLMYKVTQNGKLIKSGALNTVYTGSGEAGAAIHEVPLLHVQDLAHGTYEVLIQAVVSYDWGADKEEWIDDRTPPVKLSYLYFDGVRVYNPIAMGSGDRDLYIDGEDTARFIQLRDMILKGQAAAAKIDANGLFSFGSGLVSYVEKAQNRLSYEGNKVTSLNDYLVAGPNNEVYFNENTQTLVLYVKETGEKDVTPMLQIGVRNLNPEAFDKAEGDTNNAPAFALLGAGGEVVQTLVKADKAISYTEQYHTVNYKSCVVEPINGVNYYRVVITARNSSAFALTNLKVSGLEFYTIPASAATYKYDKDGNLIESTNPDATAMPSLQELAWQLQAANGLLPEDETPGEATELKFRSVSLTLQSSIGMNIYVAKESLEGFTKPFVKLTKTVYDEQNNPSTVTVTLDTYIEVTAQGMENLVFHYDDVSAKEMASNVQMQLFATKEGDTEATAGEIRDYSVVQYAKNMLTRVTDDDLKTLLVDMVNYGAQAQVYFGYNTENPANAEFDAYQEYATKEKPEMNSYAEFDGDNPMAPAPEGATDYLSKVAGVSLLLNEKVELNIFVKYKDALGNANEGKTLVVAYSDVFGNTVVKKLPITAAELDSKQQYYRVTFDSLNATDMRTAFTAWVVDDSGMRVSNSLTYSIESYCASMMAGTSEVHLMLQPLLVEMMKYGDSAVAYFGKTVATAQ